jgi:riboflavin kinase/FMN adenylyltransferase
VNPRIRIIRHLPSTPSPLASALSIGNFDGVHLGHQAMLSRVVQAATQRGLTPSVLTFTPHPRVYFANLTHQPERAPSAINSLRDRLRLLSHFGIQQITLLRFNQALASMTPTTFVESLLIDQLKTKWLLVGQDFKFGHQRRGNIELLQSYADRGAFELSTINDVGDSQGRRISSSSVREALSTGDIGQALERLGHPFTISGHVKHGQKLGRTLGFPTLNVSVAPHCSVKIGIYVVRVHGLGAQPLMGVASLGRRPTVTDTGHLLLEVHLIDKTIDAYGKLVCVDFLHFLRGEEKFSSLQTLTLAMQHDTLQARQYFAENGL